MGLPRATTRADLFAEEGFGLIEVLVSALIVVVISLAVLGSMDAAGRASGTGKAKATAANLAQQDQDRLQAMRPADLIELDTVQDKLVTVDDQTVTYEVRSQGDYVLNPSSADGCTSTKRDEYLRIVSTVSSPDERSRPVRIESLIAPPLEAVAPNQGSAVIKLTRADGVTPVVGQLVKLVGAQTSQQVTGPEGCAYFANQPVGAYAFEFATSGWVDPNGDSAASLPVGVTSQEVASLDALYDQAGRINNAGFVTAVGGVYISTKADKLVMSHPSVKRDGGTRSATTTQTATPAARPPNGTWAASLPNLFPFSSPYAVYSGGQCGEQLPVALAALVVGGGRTTSLKVDRGVPYNGRFVFEPALNPTVRYGTGPNPPAQGGARVLVRSTDPLCPTPVTQTTRSVAVANGPIGTVEDPGFPYGDYEVCAEHEYAPGRWRRSGWQSKTNDQLGGVSWPLDVSSTSADDRC